ncbi:MULTISPECIES: Cys-tRNA(Pro) deacylase [unclassified Vibrio]|uniref:Cys-tRNA(Pro)/Cys-tRNA(Cys) deacylase n=1 Tax=Vibrio sp. HB236076 TaxID=3232307 RepID=A0AB39H923_9VIBR|nr:Cys-tRNA(Pro) deacylase [Vibrio sp. HB161653]MDP5254234.1 Cys-tRNA(Pro) deacylase [Vibrio sp. HB161653]
MTPAIELAEKRKISYTLHQYQHDPRATSFGLEAAEALGQDANKVFKTLLVSLNGNAKELAVTIIPVAHHLNLKQAAKALGVKKVAMADPKIAETTTGYILGGISPLGQKKALPTVLDVSAQAWQTICVSAGRRGLEIELSASDLLALTRGKVAKLID